MVQSSGFRLHTVPACLPDDHDKCMMQPQHFHFTFIDIKFMIYGNYATMQALHQTLHVEQLQFCLQIERVIVSQGR